MSRNAIDLLMKSEKFLWEIIPVGTRNKVRGDMFNKIVQKFILRLKLDKQRFEIRFETPCKSQITSEIPDWYILEKSTNGLLFEYLLFAFVWYSPKTVRNFFINIFGTELIFFCLGNCFFK